MAEKTETAGKPVGEMEKTAKRKARVARIDAQNKVTLILETDLRKFLAGEAKQAGMELTPFLQKLIETHVIDTTPDGDRLGDRLRARRAVLDYAVNLAVQVDQEGGFDEHFILTVMQRARSDAEFARLYDLAVGADPEKPKRSARARVPLNQQLGRLIKGAAKARGKRNDKGKIMRAQVQDELITTYTLLDRGVKAAA